MKDESKAEHCSESEKVKLFLNSINQKELYVYDTYVSKHKSITNLLQLIHLCNRVKDNKRIGYAMKTNKFLISGIEISYLITIKTF